MICYFLLCPCSVREDGYLKHSILLFFFSLEETDQSTQELFTTKIPRTTELAKTTQGNAVSPLLEGNFSLFSFDQEILLSDISSLE